MGIIKVKNIGSFSKTEKYFERLQDMDKAGILDEIAQETLEDLIKASPRRDSTGEELGIASSWSYEIIRGNKSISILFNNSRIQNGVNIAVIVNNGHASRSGKWVPGQHFIEEPIDNACKKIMKHLSKGVK